MCWWQVDFSQSVHHLWKQFRRHGKAGGAEEAAAAAEQGAGDSKRPAPRDRLDLKPGAGGLYAGPAGKAPWLQLGHSPRQFVPYVAHLLHISAFTS